MHNRSTEKPVTKKHLTLHYFVEPSQQGLYLTLPFRMPPGVEAFSLAYSYPRYQEEASEEQPGHTARREINIIDLGLIAPDGSQVGASGSDKNEIWVSETHATPGYRPCPLVPGEWLILIGAYKVAPPGVTITYELTFTLKRLRLLKGDLHTHTLGSDGALSVSELAHHAQRHGLDFLGITDHNQIATSDSLPRVPDFTLISGVEWTHYQGHALFLGADQPYDEPFFTNTWEETQARFHSARERGALIAICHPRDELCPFLFDMHALPFDCLEIWNGPMRPANLQAIELWQALLSAGQKVPLCGGSDYHRDGLFQILGGPTTCVYALSSSQADILSALKNGHAYLTFAPNGPGLEMTAGEALIGDSLPFSSQAEVKIKANGLLAGDLLRVVTAQGSSVLLKATADGKFEDAYAVETPGFVRLEILRQFAPGLPPLPALISNPIYFDDINAHTRVA